MPLPTFSYLFFGIMTQFYTDCLTGKTNPWAMYSQFDKKN